MFWATYMLMMSPNITRLKCRQGKRNLQWCTLVQQYLVRTKLSNKCSSQFHVLFSLQQHITQSISCHNKFCFELQCRAWWKELTAIDHDRRRPSMLIKQKIYLWILKEYFYFIFQNFEFLRYFWHKHLV